MKSISDYKNHIRKHMTETGSTIEFWIEKVRMSALSGELKVELVTWLESAPCIGDALAVEGDISDIG